MWYTDVYYRVVCVGFFFFQAEDGIRDLVRSRGLGDVYKRQVLMAPVSGCSSPGRLVVGWPTGLEPATSGVTIQCLSLIHI